MTVVLITLGVALLLNGAILIFSSLNLGVLMTVFLGLCLIALGIIRRRGKRNGKKRRLRILSWLFAVALCVELVFVTFLAAYGNADTVSYEEDAVIVLGAGLIGDTISVPLQRRLDRAVAYHRENPEAVIVVTGGQGNGETVTEASVMAAYLIRQGIDADCILQEGRATSTAENMQLSKELLDSVMEDPYSIAVMTNGFHIYRSVLLARRAGFTVVNHCHATLAWFNVIPCYLRETLAVLKTWIFG